MHLALELVPVPVTSIERAKAFYTDRLGFHVDHDVRPASTVRVVQLTPPGSACSILLSTGLSTVEMNPGTLRGLHLVVDDIVNTREKLTDRGVEVGEVEDLGGMLYAGFGDPDGNTWTLQEITGRA
jgi:catechol 2,3-dioxygenase-like lactoylglutathione lyase family enzyme